MNTFTELATISYRLIRCPKCTFLTTSRAELVAHTRLQHPLVVQLPLQVPPHRSAGGTSGSSGASGVVLPATEGHHGPPVAIVPAGSVGAAPSLPPPPPPSLSSTVPIATGGAMTTGGPIVSMATVVGNSSVPFRRCRICGFQGSRRAVREHEQVVHMMFEAPKFGASILD